MKRVVTEPMLHFLLLSGLLFGAYTWLNRGGESKPTLYQVRISEADVAWLKTTWIGQRQREPTREELRVLVASFLREELLAREARNMRLDENDAIVRRRLAQKLEFIVQDVSRLAEPTDEELRHFYATHPERFQSEPTISFEHIFFSREQRKNAWADAAATLAQSSEIDTNSAQLGDRLLVDSELRDVNSQTVAALFGPNFAKAIFKIKTGIWQGPIDSGYGVHVVRVSKLTLTEQQEFSDARPQVIEQWYDQRRRSDNEKYFAGLLKKYNVVVDDRITALVGPPANWLTVASASGGGRE